MWVSSLKLINFRNYRSLEREFPPGLVVLSGDNAQGKTNFLEALYLLAIAKSYRAATERELVNWGATPDAPTQVIAAVQRAGEQLHILVTLQPIMGLAGAAGDGLGGPLLAVVKHIRVNGLPRPAWELVGRVTAVLFSAQDIDLVLGAPALRRRYLDILLCQVDRDYLRTLQRYQRTLTQRNHLLRRVREGRGSAPEEFGFWEDELARSGARLMERRIRCVTTLAERAAAVYQTLTRGTERLEVAYAPSLTLGQDLAGDSLEAALRRTLEQQRPREIAAGLCLTGPHRDDLDLQIDNANLGLYGSRGQARTVALALRLAEAAFLRQERGEEPVLLLDDVLSELDRHRRRQVLEHSASFQQVFLTTTDPDLLEPVDRSRATCFTVAEGQVRRQG